MKEDNGYTNSTKLYISNATSSVSDASAAHEWNKFNDEVRETRQQFQTYYTLSMSNSITKKQTIEFKKLLKKIQGNLNDIFLNTGPAELMLEKYLPQPKPWPKQEKHR